MEFHGGDKVEVCSEEEGFLGSYYAATAVKSLVEEENMSKHLIEANAILDASYTSESIILLLIAVPIPPVWSTVVAALASDPNVWNAVWENKALQELLQSQNAKHAPDAADEKAGSSTTEKTLGASLMALAVMVIMVVVLRRP
ncbi:hypothetical protein D5086_021614 [Populus alba]|uniref:Uncharacterized protein n=1 Tax=Populus alba TaxID=43335 RepID=A0ACC4BD83_POPAL